MPSEAELVAQFGVSRMTVNRALRELQAEGLVERVQGVGTFAAQLHRVSSHADDPRPARRDRRRAGTGTTPRCTLAREEAAAAALASALGLEPGAPVFHTLIVHHENGVPLQCEDRYVNPACAPDYLERRLHADDADALPARGRAAVGGAVLDRGQRCRTAAGSRGCWASPPATRAWSIVRRTVSRGVPVTIARLVHPGSR